MPLYNTHAKSLHLCPCEDCKHWSYCYRQEKECKVFTHWSTYGSILKRKGVPVEKEPNQIDA